MRVGFVGELLANMPTNSLTNVWNGLLEAGKASDIKPFGVEAQRLLRLKVYLILWPRHRWQHQPFEVNLGWEEFKERPILWKK